MALVAVFHVCGRVAVVCWAAVVSLIGAVHHMWLSYCQLAGGFVAYL